MHEILNSFNQKSIPKFQQKIINFSKLQNLSKPQNLGFKTWNACKWEKRDIPSEEKTLKTLEKHLDLRFGVRESDLGGEETKLSRERSREMKTR